MQDIEVIIETKKGERAEAPKKDGFANMRISRAGIQESIKTGIKLQRRIINLSR